MNRPRRFTLLDGMIVVAAIAPGFLLWKSYERVWPIFTYHVLGGEHGPWQWKSWVAICGLVPPASMLTIALLPIGLAGPRVRIRRFLRLPGTIASLVAIASVLVAIGRAIGDWPALRMTGHGEVGRVRPEEILALRLVGLKDLVGPGLAMVWFLLWLGGGWRPEPTWVDRAGRALGWAWIAFGMVSWATVLIA